MVKRVISALVVVAVLLGGGYLAYKRLVPAKAEAAGPVYATAKVKRGDLRVSVEGTGQLQPIFLSELTAAAPGTVESILVERGQRVEPGQLVATLRNDQIGYELQELEFDLERARLELADVLGVPPGEVTRVDPTRGVQVSAPISGRITDLKVKNGDSLEEGTLVATIVDDAAVIATVEMNVNQVKSVAVGQKAVCRFVDFQEPVEGTVTDVDRTPVPESYFFSYTATIEIPNPGLLKPGQKFQLTIKSPSGDVPFLDLQTASRYRAEEVVRSLASGTVTSVNVRNMEKVEKGEAIVTLGGEKTKRYVEKKQLDIRQMELQIAQKQDVRNKLEVRSPIAGTVAWIWGNPGMQVQAGQSIGSIFDNSRMNLNIMIDELDVVNVKEGQEATITVDALPGKSWTAKVQRVDMMGQTEGGFAQYGVFLEVGNTQELKPGMTANVSIFVDEKKNVLLIPIEAIFEEDGEAKVEVLTQKGSEMVPETVPVKIGLSNDRWAEVLSGLEEGQSVVTGSSLERLSPEETEKEKEGLVLPGATEGKPGKSAPTKPAPKPAPEPEAGGGA
ncbi:MAG TPA: efflux RND transporter periplasmic adaptor subunit [Firmicutes bacterium]|nr:efflux RND transporter periplasmic adaptor subunit [Bacillota bacterium]